MRDIPVGNGSLLVNFDDRYQIRDIYFPHVGQENHTEGFPFRFGVWADGEFSWIFEDDWRRSLKYLPESLVTDVRLVNESIGIEIVCNDTVASHENVFIRRVRVTDLKRNDREIRIFLHQDFRIYENKVGDTAFYDPESLSLIHYKKHRYFLINTLPHFNGFTTGRKAFRDHEGTWRDAEDGELHRSAKTEGSVDSTIRIDLRLEPGETQEFYYWIAAGRSHDEVVTLNRSVLSTTPENALNHTENFWRVWVNKNDRGFEGLSAEVADHYKRSLLVTRTQIDNCGSILAANDSAVTERATDHYSYLWTRDGAFVANALDLAGYPYLTRSFFLFCSHILHDDGYFLQKYNADGTVASGWHSSWDVSASEKVVPIQEDETSLVLWALWEHYDKFRELEFSHRIYRPLVTKCADFLVDFIDEELGLPKPSWNLWEDRRGIHTFTCATVVGGLRAAAKFARLFDEAARAEAYDAAADSIAKAMREHLFSKDHGRFLRSLESDNGGFREDATVDASLFALFYFGVFEPDDEMVVATMRAVEERLWVPGGTGGVARFEHDQYMRVSDSGAGNPWFICTLWLAEYRTAVAKKPGDLKGVVELLEWAVKNSLPSGVMAEQLDPDTGGPVSVSPLTWSHSTFVAAVCSYLKKLEELEAA
jgi:oligosaccharide amylase